MFKPVKSFPTRDVTQLHPKVKSMVLLWLRECKKAGIIIGISNTYRSTAYQTQQHKLHPTRYAEGGFSMHEFRCAVDFYINMKGKGIYDDALVRKAGAIAKRLGFYWGGDFTRYDGCHIQYTKPYTEKQIRSGKIPV